MRQNQIDLQWQKLFEEHEAERDAYLRAFSPVSQKFAAMGTSSVNPTDAERREFEKTRHAWQDVLRRVGEFVKESGASTEVADPYARCRAAHGSCASFHCFKQSDDAEPDEHGRNHYTQRLERQPPRRCRTENHQRYVDQHDSQRRAGHYWE